jgi:transcriptional regulator with XRE-family HTH domain
MRKLTVNQVFAYRLWEARTAKGWSQKDLADEMTRNGHTFHRGAISKIELGARGIGTAPEGAPMPGRTPPRQVSLAEAIAFAAVLDVPPASLFLPISRGAEVQLTAEIVVDVDTAHAWSRGERPLKDGDPDAERFYSFQTLARPYKATLEDLEKLGIKIVHEPPSGGSGKEQEQ